jgi:hypothetical protein
LGVIRGIAARFTFVRVQALQVPVFMGVCNACFLRSPRPRHAPSVLFSKPPPGNTPDVALELRLRGVRDTISCIECSGEYPHVQISRPSCSGHAPGIGRIAVRRSARAG